MAPVVVIQSVFFLLAVLQQRTSVAAQSGFILRYCPVTPPRPTPSCLVQGVPPIRRDDYTYTPGIGGHKIHTRGATWHNARRTCEEEGGHLAIINSIAEAEAITDLFNKAWLIFASSASSNWAFIGFHDLYQEGEYVTIHSHSLAKAGYTQWRDGEPSTIKNGHEEDCGSVHKNGGLNDILCTDKLWFICELPIY